MDHTVKPFFGKVEKILIRSANWVGDAVMSLPSISAVRCSFPNAHIAVLAKPWVAGIFQENPLVDEVILYQKPGLHQGLGGKWRLARQLRHAHFDLAFLLPNSFESALIPFLAGIPRRAGYRTDGRILLLTHPVKLTAEVKAGHQVDYYLAMVGALGFASTNRFPELKISAEREKEAERFLNRFHRQGQQKIVGLSPGATYGPAKQWFPERFGELADRLTKIVGTHILLFGSQKDKDIAVQVKQNSSTPLTDLTGMTTLEQAMALIARCSLFITNDSGLMHIAAALGVPLVGIFGSTDPQRTGPRGSRCQIVQKPIPCAPCLRAECPDDRR